MSFASTSFSMPFSFSQASFVTLSAADITFVVGKSEAYEAGKGFAVVAEEIRKLSDSSNESIGRIDSIIKNISKSVDVANTKAVSVSELNSIFEDVSETATEILKDTKSKNYL